MPVLDNTVKVFHNLCTSAPALNGQAGSLINILTACLVDGFGPQTIDSITVSGGVATVTRAAGHTFEKSHVARISASSVPELNGDKKVVSATPTSYTFYADGVPDQTVVGAQHAYAPAGWARPHFLSNVAHFRAASGSRQYLRVSDSSAARDARVAGLYEADSIANVGQRFPTDAQLSGGGWVGKSNTVDSTARPWVLIADGRMMYFFTGYSTAAATLPSSPLAFTLLFGDLESYVSGDQWGCLLGAAAGPLGGGGTAGAAIDMQDIINPDGTNISAWLARSALGLPNPIPALRAAPRLGATAVWRSGAGNQPFPNPADGAFYLTPYYCMESHNFCLRGVIPGIYICPQNIGKSGLNFLELLNSAPEFSGKHLVKINSAAGMIAVDLTGPWR